MRDALREQLRGHLLHFLVCHIDRQSALVCDAQPPECCPSEIVKVRNVRPVCLRQCDLQIAQPRFYVLVLVVKFRVHLHAAAVGLLKVPVYRLLRDPAGLEIFVHHFLNGRLQDLLPCRKRHRKRLLDGRRRLPAHPAQIVLRLLWNAVQRESGRPTPLLRILRHRIAELADRRGSAHLRQCAVVKVISDVLQNLVCVRAARILRAGDRVSACVVNVQNDLAAFLADEVAERVHLCLRRHDGKVDSAALRGNPDVALLHEAHHAARVVSSAVVLAECVNDVPVIDASVSAGAALVPSGEVQPRTVQQNIARLAPFVCPPKVGECCLVVFLRRRRGIVSGKFCIHRPVSHLDDGRKFLS